MAPHAITEGTGPLTDAERRAVMDDLRELMAVERSITQDVVARSANVGRTIVSQLLKGTYKGKPDPFVRKLARWMADRAERAEAPVAGFVMTGFARDCHAVCRRALAVRTIGQIVAPAGLGKSMALREFARLRGPDRCLYLVCTEATASLAGIVAELAERLGIVITTRSSTARLYKAVRQRLADFYAEGAGPGFIVIADEAQTLSPRARHALRNLHDDPACGTAVVFSDTARWQAGLTGRGAKALYEQLTSRIRSSVIVADDDEVPAADVRAVAERVAGGKLSAAAVAYLADLAREHGKLRNVAVRIQTVLDVAEAAGVTPRFTAAELDFVADLVGARALHPEWPNPFEAEAGEPTALRHRDAEAQRRTA